MKKILIIEDEISYIKLLKDQLESKGYLVITTGNGKDGLEITQKEKPDLILLDIKMPVMDGATMLNLLRQTEFGKSVKVIMLTNLEPDTNIIDNAINNHLTYYYVKSDTKFIDLLNKIKEIINE